jgi:hypothetical protein
VPLERKALLVLLVPKEQPEQSVLKVSPER